MAGNKVNAKTKGKEDKSKVKSANSANDDEDVDFAMLRKPIPTSITGFAQARKIFDLATEELKDLLKNECDLLYECKVCRNIFRSLANFISHKRVYCKEKFSSSIHSEFVKATSTASELSKIVRIERGYQEFLKSKNSLASTEDDNDDRVPITRDLTDLVERLTKTKGVPNHNADNQMILQKIPNSSVAVFQNLKEHDVRKSDKMRAQVRELDHILSRDQAVLQSDGKFTIVSSKGTADRSANSANADAVIQISDDDEEEQSLKCKICALQFSTLKTLKFHMKYKHMESRLVYPCTDCVEIFSTSWSVYRHLFKVHRKTAAQIRRLRESIQSKAFKMNNPPAFYERRKNTLKMAMPQKLSDEERIAQENLAWMDNIEADSDMPRCGGCGRTFERRAALAAHTQTCQPRNRALARKPDAKKIEIQIRKDYNKGPSGITIMKPTGIQEKAADEEESRLAKANNEMENPESTENTEQNDITEPNESTEQNEMDDDDDKEEDTAMDVCEDDAKSDDSNELPDLAPDPDENIDVDIKASINLPYSIQSEKSNLAAFKQRINPHIDFNSLVCKKCDTKQKSALELFKHMASHFKWKRYACKLCNFKHYDFEKLPEHVKVVHKLKGDSDFYCSTVKAIDGTEAMLLSRCLEEDEASEEANDQIETSPESRRPSRCSSDSSRLSDDSTSSSNVKEGGARKRKKHSSKIQVKRKKDTNDEDIEKNGDISEEKAKKVILGDSNSVKQFEDNSSDMDDIEERVTKRHSLENASTTLTTSRRPVRNKTKPKNKDFEYDLSNLLKMEAQGYRDSQQVVSTKTYPIKKKISPDTQTETQQSENNKKIDNNKQLDNIKHSCSGALAALSRKAVEKSAAHMRTAIFAACVTAKERPSNVFARPMLPKGNKSSPRKESTLNEDAKECIQNKVTKGTTSTHNNTKDVSVFNTVDRKKTDKNEQIHVKDEFKNKKPGGPKPVVTPNQTSLICNDPKPVVIPNQTSLMLNESVEKVDQKEVHPTALSTDSTNKTDTTLNLNIPAVLPMKIRRQSLEVMKPIINKNITDFSKAGMKTKILVIKPIKKNKDGSQSLNTSLKFQAIKLKDSNRGISNDDQAVLVKVPKVTCNSATELATQTNSSSVMSITKIIEPEVKAAEDVPATLTVLEPSMSNESQSVLDDIAEHESNVINTEDADTIDTMNEEIVSNTQPEKVETVEENKAID